MLGPMVRNASLRRLYVDHPLSAAQRVPLSRDQAHYLFNVMRLSAGDQVIVFNGTDGEWLADVAEAGKKGGVLACATQTRPQTTPPDLWLLCAPIRKERMAFVVEKAVELGVSKIVPVQTEYTQGANRVRQDKLQATAIEAAEQCEALSVPQVLEVQKLKSALASWPTDRKILHCDESLSLKQGHSALTQFSRPAGPWAILIGPEGGFSTTETDHLRTALPDTIVPIGLGPRILRAETAAIAAMTLWQAHLGDWT